MKILRGAVHQLRFWLIKMIDVSALILAKNEENRIATCLASLVAIPQKVVIVDSATIDATREVSRSFGAEVYEREFTDFSSQRNFGLGKVSCPWVLTIDADEEMPFALEEEISKLQSETSVNGYWVKRRNILFGQPMQYGGFYPDKQLRVFRAEGAEYRGKVHELPSLVGEIGFLQNELWHYSDKSFGDRLRKLGMYSGLRGEQRTSPASLFGATKLAGKEFLRRVVREKAYLDGWRGVYLSGAVSVETLLAGLKKN